MILSYLGLIWFSHGGKRSHFLATKRVELKRNVFRRWNRISKSIGSDQSDAAAAAAKRYHRIRGGKWMWYSSSSSSASEAAVRCMQACWLVGSRTGFLWAIWVEGKSHNNAHFDPYGLGGIFSSWVPRVGRGRDVASHSWKKAWSNLLLHFKATNSPIQSNQWCSKETILRVTCWLDGPWFRSSTGLTEQNLERVSKMCLKMYRFFWPRNLRPDCPVVIKTRRVPP